MYFNFLASAWALPNLRRSTTELAQTLSKKAIITFPSDDAWEALLTRGSYPRIDPDYSVVIQVGTEADVQKTLAFAKKYDIPFLAVSGAHGWTDILSRFPYGIQVNMRQLNTAAVDKGGKTATIGGGALQWEVVKALFAKGKQAVTGLAECVSVIGPLLGGGHSLLQGKYGYALDNLISARVVLSDGSVAEASSSKNPDLFWALKGAGHNFGIVTSYVVKAFDIKTDWTVYSLIYTEDKLEALFALINKHEDGSIKRPVELALTGVFVRIPGIDVTNPVIAYTVAYQGSEAAAAPYAARFQALGPTATTITSNVNYAQLYTVTGNNLDSAACIENHNLLGSGVTLPTWDAAGTRAGLAIFANATADPRFATSIVLLENYGMADVKTVPFESTALAPEERTHPILASPIFWWDGDNEQASKDAHAYAAAIKDALYKGVDKTKGKRHTYVNYAIGSEAREELYGHEKWRLAKLRALKKKWDGRNAFRFYAPIE
ncbi:FAD-binding domain-containing protein [Amniculicola lignicola CBS 123094]|uniref:FAD-binding domain-containing protein n=1 Tax=Amniculicola lignicola CBS 123094 TaxID=1392246 RepID=A0A6A5WP65_9PLEO|nr:FAD-binding domain-containing protein [Amniculicola lignicola CBS 123094]